MTSAVLAPSEYAGAVWRYTFARSREHPAVHSHVELEFSLVLRGRAAYVVDEARYDLGRGSSIWLFPGQQHLLVNQSPDFEMWIAVFRRQLVEQTCISDCARPALAELPEDPAPRVLAPDALDALLKRVESTRADLDADAATFNAGLAFALLDAWNRHRAASRSEPVRRVHPAVEHAARLLRDDAAPPTVHELAARVNMSPAHLSRLFKSQIGTTIGGFRNQQRLERFMRLRESGDAATLARTALDAGFGSYPQFYRVFKRLTGVGPAGLRL
jgi:AraC-like DNA-binding protein